MMKIKCRRRLVKQQQKYRRISAANFIWLVTPDVICYQPKKSK